MDGIAMLHAALSITHRGSIKSCLAQPTTDDIEVCRENVAIEIIEIFVQ
jgi:hypothetical protein